MSSLEQGRDMEFRVLFFEFFIVNGLFLGFNKKKMIELQGVANNQDFQAGLGVFYSIPRGGVMKVSFFLVSTSCALVLLLGTSCSNEEAAQVPDRGPKVVKRIIQPPPEEIKNPVTGDEKQAEAKDERVIRAIRVAKKEEAVKPPEPKPLETKEQPEDLTGYYLVKKGDNLSTISARDDVYGNPLNWPILYRHNLDKLGKMEPDPNLPEKDIPTEMKLKIITAEAAKENIIERANKTWVINVMSTTTEEEIVAPAVTLMKEGYQVYVTNARVKGKDWMRLRVGFFESKDEADAEGKKIMAILNFVKPWTTRIGEIEHRKYAGY